MRSFVFLSAPLAALALSAWTLGAASCGGTTVIDDPGSGGSGAGSTTATTNANSTGTQSTVSTGPSGCMSHDDCPGGLCLFGSGQCTTACGEFCDACAAGEACDPCATSSCPGCEDCTAACRPINAGECDENDPCPDATTACTYGLGVGFCVDRCTPEGDCPEPGQACNECGTGSCCGCNDCVAICN